MQDQMLAEFEGVVGTGMELGVVETLWLLGGQQGV
jgi:hypothetical protein